MHDDPLGLNTAAAQSIPEAWTLPEQEPTNLIALWPHADAPTQSEIVAALENHWEGFELLDEIDPEDPNVLWTIIVNAPQLHQPAVMWCEPARTLSPGELDDPKAEACPWSIGVETLLDHDDPLESFRKLACFLAGPFEDIPGILDVNTTGWIQRSRIVEQFLPENNVPPTDVLWIIHVVSSDDDERGTWLHTHGMWRCGRPELEILQVDRARISAASQLLNDIAARIIDDPLPEPGDSFPLGDNLSVTLRPWQDVASHLAEGSPGDMSDRDQDGSGVHTGVRAVICADPGQDEPGRSVGGGLWPKDVIERLESDEAVVFRSIRATRRCAMQARYTWGELATAFVKLRPYLPSKLEKPRAVVLLKVAFPYESGDPSDSSAEHMWFEVLNFEGDRAEGKLLNTPKYNTSMKKDEVCWLERERLSDWMVQTKTGQVGPDNIFALWRAVDDVTSSQESES